MPKKLRPAGDLVVFKYSTLKVRVRGRVQANLTRIQTFVQQYDENQDVLNIKLRVGRLEEIWNKYEEIQDRLESIDSDPEGAHNPGPPWPPSQLPSATELFP